MSPVPQLPASDIHRKLIEVSRQGLVTGNFELFASCFHLPHRIATFEAVSIVDTPDQLRAVFDGVTDYLRSVGATRYERRSTSAAYKGATRIEATHESRVFNGDALVAEPWVAFNVIEFINGRWLISESPYAVAHAPVLLGALHGGHLPGATGTGNIKGQTS